MIHIVYLFKCFRSLECKNFQKTFENAVKSDITYRRTPLIQIANYPDQLGTSGKHFLNVIVLHLFMA